MFQTRALVYPRLILAATVLPLALAGCATTGSVKRAQATADQALARANDGYDAAQKAQGSADAAMGAAQKAQGTADGAANAAQGAGGTAQQALAAGQSADARIARLESRLHRLEHTRGHHRKGKHHHRGYCPTKPAAAKAQAKK
jgi:hypothetical protein